MDTLFYTISSCSFYRVILHFFIAIVYMFIHSFSKNKSKRDLFNLVSVMLVQATTLNVAFNLHNKVLLIIMMSNNFIELKGSVFKRFDKNYLFQVTFPRVSNSLKHLLRSRVLTSESVFIFSGFYVSSWFEICRRYA